MLSKQENKVMEKIYRECKEKDALLISPSDLKVIVGDSAISETQLDKIVSDLSTDGYFDLVYSDRRGEKVYCISLLEKGKGYFRNKIVMKRNLVYRIMLSASLALFSFIIGLILRKIF